MDIRMSVNETTLGLYGNEKTVVSDTIEFIRFTLAFSDDWLLLTDFVIQFTQGIVTKNVAIRQDEDEIYYAFLPSELIDGITYIRVFGYTAGFAIKAETTEYLIKIVKSGFVGDGSEVIIPTPDLYTQLLFEIHTAENTILGYRNEIQTYVESLYLWQRAPTLATMDNAAFLFPPLLALI